MSWQGDQIHFQNGGAHVNTHGNKYTLPSAKYSRDLQKIEIISKLNENVFSKPNSQDGVSLNNGIILAVLESRTDCEESNGCETGTIAEEIDASRFVSSNSDIDVQKMDEWLKHRTDSLSSIDFEPETKQSEDAYEYEQNVKIQEVKFCGDYSESKSSTECTSKILIDNVENSLELFPSDLGKTPFPCVKDVLRINKTKEASAELSVEQGTCNPMPSADDRLSDNKNPLLEISEKLLDNSFMNNSQLQEDENDLVNDAKGDLSALEFKELDKDNTLMTPQELESMPERGLEFEESVGPKEKQESPLEAVVEQSNALKNLVEIQSNDEELPREEIQTIPIFLTTGPANSTTENIESSSVPISAVATISVTTDKSNNTVTKIIINTPQGQPIKINGNTANLLVSAVENLTSETCKTLQPTSTMQTEQMSTLDDSLVEPLSSEFVEIQQVDTPDISCPSGKVWECLKPGCSRVYDKKCKLKVHMMSHLGERPFRCYVDGCDWAFTTAYKLKRHIETHERKKEFVCDVDGCRKQFTTVYNLNTHKKLHVRPNIVKCPVQTCHMMFPTRRRMELHLKEHDGMEAPYKCPLEKCGKEYYTANSISTHMRVHQKAELHCTFEGCGKVFDKTCRLQQHMRQHTGERPYVCKVEGCGWAFVSASKLTRHMRKHTGERRYTCPEESCGKSFMRAEHLQGHMVVHSQAKPFVCPHENCTAKFTAKSSLYVHLKKHNGNVEKIIYPCPIEACDKKYNCKSSLRIHMLRFHTPVLADNQMDYITLLSNDDLQEITGLENVSQDVTNGSSVTVSVPNITIPVATSTPVSEPTLVSPNDFITPALQQDVMAQHVNDGIITQLVMNNEISTTQSLKSNSVTESNVLNTGEADVETLSTSRVSQENNSGSARTDYCSNHVLMGKARKCRNMQQIKVNVDHSTDEINKCPLNEPPLINKLTPIALTQNDVILTTTAITFRDPTSGTEFVQTQLLQDDPPSGDLYHDDNLLVPIPDTGLTGELTVPVSLLSEVTSSDVPTAESNVIGVSEFSGSTINLRDLE